MQDHEKLVVVTRSDLAPGPRAVQAAHAAIDFIFEHPGRAGPWHQNSNYLVFLELKNEQELRSLQERCEYLGLACTGFREPDLGGSLTAVAIEPSPLTQKLVAKLPLLFQSQNEIIC